MYPVYKTFWISEKRIYRKKLWLFLLTNFFGGVVAFFGRYCMVQDKMGIQPDMEVYPQTAVI